MVYHFFTRETYNINNFVPAVLIYNVCAKFIRIDLLYSPFSASTEEDFHSQECKNCVKVENDSFVSDQSYLKRIKLAL